MRMKQIIILACLILIFVGLINPVTCLAHETQLHEKITESATLSSAGLQTFLGDNFASSYAPFLTGPNLSLQPTVFGSQEHSPIVWLKEGSRMEDDENTALRCRNHFYDPISGNGLTDRLDLGGIASYVWATAHFGGGVAFQNHFTWKDARAYQLSGLVESSPGTRQAKLGNLFYTLGHILHLNQDTSSPDHARNDNHANEPMLQNVPVLGNIDEPFGPHWIEQYGLDHHAAHPEWFVAPPLDRRGRTYWRNAGFQRIKDFWDRDMYTGNALVLDNDANRVSGGKLGLAELCNGNFLGEDALYVEYFKKGDNHYFPLPSRNTGTQYKTTWQSPLTAIGNSFLKDGSPILRVYLNKVAEGIKVPHHSVLGYLDVTAMTSPQSFEIRRNLYTPTINDDAVLKDYHAILIPKAIEYSAGILDYFFRGKIDGSAPVWSSASSQYTVLVKNLSGESFKGGEFTLWNDDANGNRSQVGSAFALSGVMQNNDVLQITFNSAEIAAPKFMLVYKGSIGLTGGNPSDSVDENIAIAAKKLGFHSSFESPLGHIFGVGAILPEGWLVEAGNVDTVVADLGGNNSFEGKGFLDLNGDTQGQISVDLLTFPGKEYTLTFAYARNANATTPTPAVAQFLINGVVDPLHVISISAPNTWGNLGWQTFTHDFTAATTSTQLRFRALNTGDGGVLIDAVEVTLKP
jgi:hypothetical protein